MDYNYGVCMKGCNVEIVTFTEGERSRFTAVGRVQEHSGGFTAVYPTQEDEAQLIFSEGALVMRRRGGSELQARFAAGQTGALSVGVCGHAGNIPLETQICTARRTPDGWRIALKYRLRFEDEVRIFRLHIAVNIISEEQ